MTVKAAIILLCGAGAAQAGPMWDQASDWECTMEMHLIANLEKNVVTSTGRKNTYTIDFSAGTRTSGFVDTVGDITEKSYVESRFGGFNRMVISWDGQLYPMEIVEKNGEFWTTAASGHAGSDRDIWISNYRCEAVK